MIGITRLTRKFKQVYQIAFSYMGVECREPMALAHSPSNDKFCERKRATILHEIELGTFKYRDHFPDSKRAAVFGGGGGARDTLKLRLEAYRDRVKKTLEASTFDGYRKAIDNVLVPRWGHLRISALRPSDIRDWVSEQTVTLKRIRNLLIPLRNVLNEAVADGEIEFNPVDRVELDKHVPIEKRTSEYDPNPYTEEEVRRLLGNLSGIERFTFQLWAYTGVRTGELIGLRWPRTDLEAKQIRIVEVTTVRQDKPRPKTKAGVRTIQLLPAAVEAVEELRQFTLLAGDRVTVNERSTREDRAWDDKTLTKVWKKAHAGTGIAYRNPYELRHTFASNLLSQGANTAFIAKLLGHRTVEMVVRHYARWIAQGESLGFERPVLRYGQTRLWSQSCEKRANPGAHGGPSGTV